MHFYGLKCGNFMFLWVSIIQSSIKGKREDTCMIVGGLKWKSCDMKYQRMKCKQETRRKALAALIYFGTLAITSATKPGLRRHQNPVLTFS